MRIFALLFFMVISLSCGSTPRPNAHTSGVASGSKLPSTTAKVCWTNPEGDIRVGRESGMAIVEDIVTSEYRRAGFRLTGWQPCTAQDQGEDVVKVRVRDTQPYGFFGCQDAENWCLTLNFTFERWPRPNGLNCEQFNNNENAWGCYCQEADRRKTCLQSYGLHEFGHALGLAHEADHLQNIGGRFCRERTGRDSDAVDIGSYDANSVMNYCKDKAQVVGNYAPSLSLGDVTTLARIYGLINP